MKTSEHTISNPVTLNIVSGAVPITGAQIDQLPSVPEGFSGTDFDDNWGKPDRGFHTGPHSQADGFYD
jgi:hypothetical protein